MKPNEMFRLDDRVGLVTGGARGIGLAIAEALGAFGAKIVLVDRDAVGCEEACTMLEKKGVRAEFLSADLTSPDVIEHILDTVWSEHGAMDILVNNAGMSARIPAEAYPDADFDRMVDLNLRALFFLMRGAARCWIEAKRAGQIINLASFAGLVADPLSAPYAATKGAVVQLTRTCAVEWAPHGIRVNAIAPGYVKTAMTAETLSHPDVMAAIRAKTALGRPADPAEIAGAAVFLAAPASSYITGHILAVDGGWTAM